MRIPRADGTLAVLPGALGKAVIPSLLTLTDVMAAGHHAAVKANVSPGKIALLFFPGAHHIAFAMINYIMFSQ